MAVVSWRHFPHGNAMKRYVSSSGSMVCAWLFVLVAMFFPRVYAASPEWIIDSTDAAPTITLPRHGELTTDRFASLELAIAKIRELRSRGGVDALPDGLNLRLLPGVHRLTAPIVLDESFSNEKSPISISGTGDKRAVISGGRLLAHSEKVRDRTIFSRLPEKARNHVVQFDLRNEGVTDFGAIERRQFWPAMESKPAPLELFYRRKPMVLARWPNEGFARLGVEGTGKRGERSFYVEGIRAGARLAALENERDLLATGYWGEDWASETIPIAAIETSTGLVTLQSPGPTHGILTGQRVFLENALSELDSPGEWYLDRRTGLLYFWPPALLKPGELEVSVLTALFVLKGAHHFHLSGVTLEMARGNALSINAGQHILIENVTIRDVGGRAANIQGAESRFDNLDIYDTGDGGVYLWGGDRKQLLAAKLSVSNSRIRRYSRLNRTYRPAIQLQGVGNSAIGNVISDGPHTGIMFFGNNHVIAYNDISRVALETGDAGAIYTARDWTSRGNEIRNNFLHDIHGPGLNGSRGVYLDDQASGTVIRSNLFVRVDRPIFIGGGRDNVVEDNLLVASSPAIHLDARGLTWQRALSEDNEGALRKALRDMPIASPSYRRQYPNLAGILEDEPGAPKYNVIRRNIVVDGLPADVDPDAQRWLKGDASINKNNIRFKFDTKLVKGNRATDYSYEVVDMQARDVPDMSALAAMECVTNRWRSMDRGAKPPVCKLELTTQ